MSLIDEIYWCGACKKKRTARVQFGAYTIGYVCGSCDDVYFMHLRFGGPEHGKRDFVEEQYGKVREIKNIQKIKR